MMVVAEFSLQRIDLDLSLKVPGILMDPTENNAHESERGKPGPKAKKAEIDRTFITSFQR
eukprot:1498804-Amphidinium_carterae.1